LAFSFSTVFWAVDSMFLLQRAAFFKNLRPKNVSFCEVVPIIETGV
jgi:hypothetical protein